MKPLPPLPPVPTLPPLPPVEPLPPLSSSNSSTSEDGEALVSETLLIALTPVVVTLMCFAYEIGRFNFYDIPWDLISVDLTAIIASSVGLLFFIKKRGATLLLGGLSSQRLGILFVFIPPLFAGLDAHLYWGLWLPAIIVFSVFLIISWIVVLVKWELPKHPLFGALDFTFWFDKWDKKKMFFSEQQMRAIEGVLLLFILMFTVGYWKARTEKIADVLKDNPDSIVVDITEKRIVCVGYDEKADRLSGDVVVYNLPFKSADTYTIIKREFPHFVNRSVRAIKEDADWTDVDKWIDWIEQKD